MKKLVLVLKLLRLASKDIWAILKDFIPPICQHLGGMFMELGGVFKQLGKAIIFTIKE